MQSVARHIAGLRRGCGGAAAGLDAVKRREKCAAGLSWLVAVAPLWPLAFGSTLRDCVVRRSRLATIREKKRPSEWRTGPLTSSAAAKR
jgi:hypothetical protein